MLKRKLGCNEVSILGYGCMRFPELGEGIINENKTFELLKYAFDNGVNYYDTAWPYHNGKSEEVLGRFLKTIDREKVFIANKMPLWEVRKESDLDRIFEIQLNKVGVKYFDYYLLHAFNEVRFYDARRLGMFEWLKKKKAEGKIKNIGFSFHDKYETFEKIMNEIDWDFAQIQLNYIDEDYQAGLKGLKLAAKKNVDIVIMEPLRGGVLAKRSKETEEITFKAKEEKTFVEWALRYLWDKEEIKLVLSGMNEIDQIKENIEVACRSKANTLTEDDNKIINELKEYYEKKIKVPCTSCNYCMPCPNGVDIPLCFSYYNASEKVEGEGYFQYNVSLEQSKKAGNCIKCGMCLRKCPQGINIVEKLEEVKEYFGE